MLRVAGFEEAREVKLWAHLAIPLERDFERVADEDVWVLRQPRPDLDRLEYLIEVTDGDGHDHLGPHPDNPRRVSSPFGDHSWLPMPGYAAPAWLEEPGIAHHVEHWGLEGTPVGEIDARVWSPADAGPHDDLPLLVVHDGPEMADLAGLTRYAEALMADGRLPRMRIALLPPGPERNARYGANPDYAPALAEAVAILRHRWPSTAPPVGMGASLGALSMLHTQWTVPGTFGGLWLASGSYFTPTTDPQERDFAQWDAITAFTEELLEAESLPDLGEIALVCGTAEENLANNGLVLAALRRGGVPATWGTVRDGHNYTCWRDLFDPHLTDLLRRTWR